MRILLINGDQHSRQVMAQTCTQPFYQVAAVTGKERALQILTNSDQPVIVVVDFPLAAWLDSSDFLTTIIRMPHLTRIHSYVLLLQTNETLPLAVGRIIGELPLEMVAKPVNSVTLLAVVEKAQRQQLLHNEATVRIQRPQIS